MNANETYKKIPWIFGMSEIFQNNSVSAKRLDTLIEDDQKELIYAVISTLSQYFAQIPNHNAEVSRSDYNYSAKFVQSLSNTLPVWLSGLCDLTIAQIINGLLDILNLKTEYQKWPPKSVMEFYAICKKQRAPYYEMNLEKNLRKIGFDEDLSRKRSENIATKYITECFRVLGKDYEKIKCRRLTEKRLAFKS